MIITGSNIPVCGGGGGGGFTTNLNLHNAFGGGLGSFGGGNGGGYIFDTDIAYDGENATNYGGGGGGATIGNNTSGNTKGGNGGSGVVIIRFKEISNIIPGGSGGGSFSNLSSFQSAGSLFSPLYSYATSGSNGTLVKGGDGGSALSNIPYTSYITGNSYLVGQGGTGAGSNTIPVIKTIPGSGGDGNGGIGTDGIVIIKVPLDVDNIKFDGFIYSSNIIDFNLSSFTTGVTTAAIDSASNQLNFNINHVYNNLLSLINYNRTWVISDSNIYNCNLGNVGIGTTNPTSKLHLIGNLGIEGDIIPTINNTYNLGSSNNRWKDLYLSANSIYLDNLILNKNSSNNLEIKDSNNNYKSISAGGLVLNDNNNQLRLEFNNGQLLYNSNGNTFSSIPFKDISQIVYSNLLSNTSNELLNYTVNELNKIRDLYEDYNYNTIININRQAFYSYNNEKKQTFLNIGSYPLIFTDSNLIFNGEIDNSYPVIKNINGTIIEPLSWYKFDNLNYIGIDSSIYNNHLNTNPNVSSSIGIRGNYSIAFNGEDTNPNLFGSISLINISFSICYWQYALSGINGSCISVGNADIGGYTTIYIGFGINSPLGNFTNTYNFGVLLDELITDEFTSDINKWVYLCFTYDYTNKTRKIYRNGILIGTLQTNSQINFTNSRLEIGSIYSGVFAHGYMDDLRFYNKELSVSEINELYKGKLKIYYPLTINADYILEGCNNRLITNDIYNRSITFTSNVNVLGNYQYNNYNIPFSLISYSSAKTSTNGVFNYHVTSNNFGYYLFESSGSITFINPTICDLLIVGAGGNGGFGSYSGGGGAGEVIAYPNYSFGIGSYGIQVGTSSTNSNLRISKITSNLSDLILAKGGGDGANSYIIGGYLSSNISGTNDYYIEFTSNSINQGIFNLTLDKSYTCDVLVVGGGGAGGNNMGAGGGAGGVVYQKNIILENGNYNIIVGNGGYSPITPGINQVTPFDIDAVANSGKSSVIKYNNYILYEGIGGGAGGSWLRDGINGGSGGGAGFNADGSIRQVGLALQSYTYSNGIIIFGIQEEVVV